MFYPELNIDQELNIKTKDDEIKEQRHRAEKHDYENILKLPKQDKDYFRKKDMKA